MHKLQKIKANTANVVTNQELIDSGANQSIVRTLNETDIIHTINNDMDSSNFSSSDESSMELLPSLQERPMQDSSDDESTNSEMQFEFDLSEAEFSDDDTMGFRPPGLYSVAASNDNSSDDGIHNIPPVARQSRMFPHGNNMSFSTASSCLSSISLPCLAPRI